MSMWQLLIIMPLKDRCLRTKSNEEQNHSWLGNGRKVEKVHGRNHTIDAHNHPTIRSTFYCSRKMDYLLGKDAKFNKSYRTIQVTRSTFYLSKQVYAKEIFQDISKQMLETSYILNLGQLFKIALELNKYLW
jgi:hypothetical protein